MMEKNTDSAYKKKLDIKVVKRYLRFFKKPYLPWNYLIEPLFNWVCRIDYRLHVLYEETFLRNLFPAFEMYFKIEVIKN